MPSATERIAAQLAARNTSAKAKENHSPEAEDADEAAASRGDDDVEDTDDALLPGESDVLEDSEEAEVEDHKPTIAERAAARKAGKNAPGAKATPAAAPKSTAKAAPAAKATGKLSLIHI